MPKLIEKSEIEKYHELALEMQLRESANINIADNPELKKTEERRIKIARRCDIKKVIADIPLAMQIASLQGKTKVKVMRVSLDDYTHPGRLYYNGDFNPNWLKGIAHSVYSYCIKCGLKPTIELYVEEDHGSNIRRHDIYIEW